LPDMISARARLAHHYCQELGKIKNVYTPQFSNTRIWYRYVIRLDNFDLSVIESEAFTLGISVARPVELWIDETVEGMDNARYAWTSLLSLPLYPTLSKKEHKYVCDVIKKLVA
jgi:dTDP-4-amino-4,6-dideoxygalactose transaminase